MNDLKNGVDRAAFSVMLPQSLGNAVRRVSTRTGLTRSAIVAMALDHYLQLHSLPSPCMPVDRDASKQSGKGEPHPATT